MGGCCANTVSLYHLGSQERASHHLELELQVVVSSPVGAGHLTQVLWKVKLLITEPSLPARWVFMERLGREGDAGDAQGESVENLPVTRELGSRSRCG